MIEIYKVPEENEHSKPTEKENKDLRKNGSGYPDPTAYDAITHMDEEKRFHKLLDTLYYISEMAGFEISERVILTDKKTGRVWR